MDIYIMRTDGAHKAQNLTRRLLDPGFQVIDEALAKIFAGHPRIPAIAAPRPAAAAVLAPAAPAHPHFDLLSTRWEFSYLFFSSELGQGENPLAEDANPAAGSSSEAMVVAYSDGAASSEEP